ncbi:DNA packaging protein FI [Klebsiella pneumoniae subsp. pneumoniae]|uniref:DNA-packaging protein FI n=1 Tax=Klebsiella TaxID=570 RepID=UPI000DA11B2E|nr:MULTISPECIES: DNA-packaging protein FI [Klebsiella]MBZ6767049.1 DNA packaging protein FI [Klebsiella oxytoca]MCD5660910.1 DNA-packaging protein FI [Klebsiella pneumoniae]PZA44838.1 DNA packaging protein FI [Klebsiella pneumoniae subsp. pneumoniae]PZA58324.1 DNA packaging protein FI [Klebsiella pneumoniae subsp. pneumoniae]PZA61875.1 DNA packaging protein FI [Klebsiella pneumoniae subsp. pneumoniae]
MSKETDLKRLQELATALGRTPDLSGSAADIRQRVAEWEEEALALSGDEGDGSDGNIIDGELITRTEEKPTASGWRRVKARQTFHAHAREVDSDRRKELILLDEVVRVPEAVLARLIAAGLVDEY